MLPTQIVTIPFTGGLDTKTSPPLVNAASFLELENVVFTETGALKKRWGYEPLGTRIEGTARRLGTLVGGTTSGPELLAFEESEAFAYMPSTMRWISRGAVTSVPTTTQKISAPTDERLYDSDSARIGTINAHVWRQEATGGAISIHCAITDDDGRKYMGQQLAGPLASNPHVKVVAFSGFFLVLYRIGAAVWCKKIRAANPSVVEGSPVSLLGDMETTTGHFDAKVIGDYLFIAYDGNDGISAGVYLRRFDANLVEQAPLGTHRVTTSYNASRCIALFSDSANRVCMAIGGDDTSHDIVIWAAYDYSFATPLKFDEITTTIPINTLTRVTGIVPADSSVAQVYWESMAVVYEATVNLDTNATTVVGAVWRTAALESRPFEHAGVVYLTLSYGSELSVQPTYFVVDVANRKLVSKFAHLTGTGNRTVSRVSEWVQPEPGQFRIPHGERGKYVVESGIGYAQTGSSATVVDFSSHQRYLSAELDRSLLIAGGIVQSYDGTRFAEHGPLLFPEFGTATAGGASTGSLSSGIYQYRFVYEMIDNRGVVARSAPSPAMDVDMSAIASGSVSLTFPVLHFTSDFDRVNLVVYRTKANEDIFFRVWSAAQAKDKGLIQTIGAATVTVLDDVADSDIEGNEILYTEGGYLENIAPPSCTTIASFKGRVVIAGTPDPNRVWFSKLSYPGTAIGFNDQFTIDVDPDGGPITALGVLDDKLVVFKRGCCFYVQGNGPDDTAQGFDFFPTMLSPDVGCVDPGSVVSVPGALMFRSAKGIYAISSGLSVSYAGAPVEAYNGTRIVSATAVPNRNVVIFVGDSGNALVFDYVAGKWSTFTNHAGVWCGIDYSTDKLVIFRANGTVHRQSDTLYTDDGNAIKMRVVTGWLAQSDMLGWQRVQRVAVLGDWKGRHDLRVRIGQDFLPPYTQEAVIPVSSLITKTTYGTGVYGSETPYGGKYPSEKFAVQLKRQKCIAVRVSIEDVQTSGYNEGLVLRGIAFRVGAKQGLNKQSHDRKIGAA